MLNLIHLRFQECCRLLLHRALIICGGHLLRTFLRKELVRVRPKLSWLLLRLDIIYENLISFVGRDEVPRGDEGVKGLQEVRHLDFDALGP